MKSGNAVAVVKPIGVVYAASSRGAVRIAGARIVISTDENGVNTVSNSTDGFAPNLENENPLTTNANGEFSFNPHDNSAAGQETLNYFLNVSAPNFRARRLSVTLVPTGVAGLYNVTIRSLDGQSLAVAGGFELTSSNVSLDNLFALVFNIPLFDLSTLEINTDAARWK